MTFRLLKQAVIGADVPMAVFDNLYSAKENDLKVILYVLNKGSIDVAEISAKFDITVASVTSALFFWADKGLIAAESTDDDTPKKKRLTAQEILILSDKSPEIKVLVSQLQKIYGHAINEKGIESFISLYINEGIPVDVILILAVYFAPVSKGAGYTARTIRNLYEKDGVTTAEKAEEYITLQKTRDERYAKVCVIFSLDAEKLTRAEKTIIDRWYEKFDMSDEMIAYAKDVADINASVRYCGGILKSWSQKGYKTPSDIIEVHNEVGRGSERQVTDDEDIMLKNMHIVPVYGEEDNQ